MSFKPWSIATVFLVTFAFVVASGFGAVTGTVLVLLIAAALVMPAVILKDAADSPSPLAADIGGDR